MPNVAEIELTITELGAGGDGIAKEGGDLYFVAGTCPGDRVRVKPGEKKRHGTTAELIEILEESKDRITPACQHFGACGGCSLQFLSDDTYKEWVSFKVSQALKHHDLEHVKVLEPKISPANARRRVGLKAMNAGGKILLGFNEKKSNKLVDLKECPVADEAIVALLPKLKVVLKDVIPAGKPSNVHITRTYTGLDILIETKKSLTLDARQELVDFAHKYNVAAIHLDDGGFMDPVIIRREPLMKFGETKVPLPPAAFVQATPDGETAIVNFVVENCKGAKRVADLFAGIGTFTLPLAETHQVLAIEGSKAAHAGLKAGVNRAVGLKQILTAERDLFRRPLIEQELSAFDVVVLDPPRAGAREQVERIALSDVNKVVSISCSPDTFARDARLLCEAGFEIKEVQPIGQFRWTAHVEVAGVLVRET